MHVIITAVATPKGCLRCLHGKSETPHGWRRGYSRCILCSFSCLETVHATVQRGSTSAEKYSRMCQCSLLLDMSLRFLSIIQIQLNRKFSNISRCLIVGLKCNQCSVISIPTRFQGICIAQNPQERNHICIRKASWSMKFLWVPWICALWSNLPE